MTNTTPDLSYTTIALLSREAHRLCRLRYSEQRQYDLFTKWETKIDAAQRLDNAAAIADLEKLISFLKGK